MNDRLPTLAPGWYPDPWHRFEYRYFNGTSWTTDVSVGGQRRIDTVRQTAASTSEQGPNTPALAALAVMGGATLLGLIPYLFVITVPAVIVGAVLARHGLRQARATGGRGRAAAAGAMIAVPLALGAAGAGAAFTVAVERQAAKTQPARTPEVRVTRCEVVGGQAVVAGKVTNSGSRTADLHLVVSLAVSGNEPALVQVDHADVAPGAAVAFDGSAPTFSPQTQCTVVSALWRR